MRRCYHAAFAAAVLLGALLASTGGVLAGAQGGGLPPEMLGKTWNLVSLQASGQPAQDTRGKGLTIQFGADGNVSGSGGCNNFSATYETTGAGALTIKQPIAATAKACEDAVDTLERQYFDALSKIDRYALNGATGLKIGYDTGKGELVYESGAPTTLPTTGDAGDHAAALLALSGLALAAGLWLRVRATAPNRVR